MKDFSYSNFLMWWLKSLSSFKVPGSFSGNHLSLKNGILTSGQSSILISIKILDLLLCCWNSNGISKIASKVGILLAVDALISPKSRLIFARVSVEIEKASTLPNEIMIRVKDREFSVKIEHDWKPHKCSICSFSHFDLSCSTSVEAIAKPSSRGRSRSCKPRVFYRGPPSAHNHPSPFGESTHPNCI